MLYDLLIKNGRIIDGSGRPAFNGDVGVAQGKIVELGRLDGPARRTIEADGRVVSRGSSTTTVTTTRRSSGIRSARSPVTTGPPA